MIGQESVASNEASLLFDALFGNYLESHPGYIALTWRKPGESRFHDEFHSDIFLASSRADDLREQKVDAFFAIAPRTRLSRKKTAIRDVLTLHIDADGKDKTIEKKIKRLRPSVLVHSGRKYCFHPYFLLDQPARSAQSTNLIEGLNKQLAIAIGIDPGVTFDTSRILRIPGTFNFKNPKLPQPVELIEYEPNLRYPLEYFIKQFGIKVEDFQQEKLTKEHISLSEQRGHFLNPDERAYIDELLHRGLFERESRNYSMLLLIRYCYEKRMDQVQTAFYVRNFFQERHNDQSKDWLSNPEKCSQMIDYAIRNWWGKAYPVKRQITGSLRLSLLDIQYVVSLNLKSRDKEFLIDALTFLLNNNQGDLIVLSARQFRKLRNVHPKNEKEKLKLLLQLQIIELKNEAKPQNRLACEYKLLYQFRPGDAQKVKPDTPPDLRAKANPDRIDVLLLSGQDTAEIRQQIPDASRQQIFYRRRRLEEIARRDQFLDG